MFLHTFQPEAVAGTVFGREVYWYGLIIAVSLLVGFIIILHISKKKRVDSNHFYRLLFFLIISGLIGGRIGHVIAEWPYYQNLPAEIIKFWQGGLAIHGVMAGCILATLAYSKRFKVSFWKLSDIIIVPLPLMQALGRWGNYFNQEIYGLPTNVPWGIPIEVSIRSADYIKYEFFHPLFLYESVAMLGVFAVILFIYRSDKLETGQLTLLYFIFFAVARFLLEFYRIDVLEIGLLNLGQWVSILIFIIASLMLFYRRKLLGRIQSENYKNS